MHLAAPSLLDSQFEILGKEGSQAAASPTQRTPLPWGNATQDWYTFC